MGLFVIVISFRQIPENLPFWSHALPKVTYIRHAGEKIQNYVCLIYPYKLFKDVNFYRHEIPGRGGEGKNSIYFCRKIQKEGINFQTGWESLWKTLCLF